MVRVTEVKAAKPLFAGWEETLIWSCLEGIMGEIYGNDPVRPVSALAHLGDFYFYAGEPDPALAGFCPPGGGPYRILVPGDEAWRACLLKAYPGQCREIIRYATKKRTDFLLERLWEYAGSLRPGYRLELMGKRAYEECLREEWSRDLVSQFAGFSQYRELGLGVAAWYGERMAAGASSYSRYREGIEIEVDTKREHRRKGLALSCAARLILECLERGLYPSWDAHTEASLSLAKKLGYEFSHVYRAIEVREEP